MVNSDSAPQPLELGVSERMRQASAALCDLKLDLDRYARGYMSQSYLNDWMGAEGTCAYWGDEFLQLVIPFLRWEHGQAESFQAYVDPRYVLGASIKGRPENIAATDVPGRIKRYAETFGSICNVHYIWYRALGILAAHEGKHRVAFMRAHDQPAIAAWVSEAQYPDASRIAIIVPDEIGEEWLALLDGRYIQVLRRPAVSSLMLRAYGVKEMRWHNLADMPDKKSVMQAVRQRGLHAQRATTAEEDRTLDVEEVVRTQQAAAEEVVRTVHDLAPYRLEWKRYGLAMALCMALALALRISASHSAHQVSLILLGAGCGLAVATSLLRFVGPRSVAGIWRAPRRR